MVGRLGLVGFVKAPVGTVLTAGDRWFETFAVTWLTRSARELISAGPPLPVMVGTCTGFGLLALGAALLGVASIRARVLPRWVGVLLLVDGLLSLPTRPSRAA